MNVGRFDVDKWRRWDAGLIKDIWILLAWLFCRSAGKLKLVDVENVFATVCGFEKDHRRSLLLLLIIKNMEQSWTKVQMLGKIRKNTFCRIFKVWKKNLVWKLLCQSCHHLHSLPKIPFIPKQNAKTTTDNGNMEKNLSVVILMPKASAFCDWAKV